MFFIFISTKNWAVIGIGTSPTWSQSTSSSCASPFSYANAEFPERWQWPCNSQLSAFEIYYIWNYLIHSSIFSSTYIPQGCRKSGIYPRGLRASLRVLGCQPISGHNQATSHMLFRHFQTCQSAYNSRLWTGEETRTHGGNPWRMEHTYKLIKIQFPNLRVAKKTSVPLKHCAPYQQLWQVKLYPFFDFTEVSKYLHTYTG